MSGNETGSVGARPRGYGTSFPTETMLRAASSSSSRLVRAVATRSSAAAVARVASTGARAAVASAAVPTLARFHHAAATATGAYKVRLRWLGEAHALATKASAGSDVLVYHSFFPSHTLPSPGRANPHLLFFFLLLLYADTGGRL